MHILYRQRKFERRVDNLNYLWKKDDNRRRFVYMVRMKRITADERVAVIVLNGVLSVTYKTSVLLFCLKFTEKPFKKPMNLISLLLFFHKD